MHNNSDNKALPEWAQTIRRKYVGGQASMFLLYGNVFDRYGFNDQFVSIVEFLHTALLADNKANIALMDPSQGIRVLQRTKNSNEAFADIDNPYEVTPRTWKSMEKRFFNQDGNALIINYASSFFPDAPAHFLSAQDRAAVVMIHRWSLSQRLAERDNVVFLITESLSELNHQLVSNPRIAVIEVPLPDLSVRADVIRHCDDTFSTAQVDRLANHASGLKAVQLQVILKPQITPGLEDQDRQQYIESLLGTQPDTAERALKLASLTVGMNRDEIRHLISPNAPLPETEQHDPLAELLELLQARKREIIEKECDGLIEFIESRHGLEAVGAMDGIKHELMSVAEAVRSGDTARAPMGLLFVGAMGTGKTFVAQAFARSSGLPAITLKNFRDRWVGSTEANLERVLSMIKALGPIILVIDEGDRAFGSGDNDGGTSSRVMARLKAFMSDSENRGQVLFIIMTNRPDKLDVDMKRAGRLDRKIPFFYPQTPEAVKAIAFAIMNRHKIHSELEENSPVFQASLQTLCGYSIADIEAVMLLAHDIADHDSVNSLYLDQAVKDYLPAQNQPMIEYMELLAVFEASRRSLLPEKYAAMSAEELRQQLNQKKQLAGLTNTPF